MKKLLVVLSVLVCALGLSMPSFAYSTIPASSCNYLSYNAAGDFYVLNKELKVSSMNDEQLEHWKLFTDAYTGQSDGEYIVSVFENYLSFYLFSSGSTFSSSSSICVSVPSAGYYSFSFELSSGNFLGDRYLLGPCSAVFNSGLNIIKTSFYPIPNNVTSVVDLNGKQLQIKDDIDEPEPEEPDPPSSSSSVSSSTPSWIPPAVSDPVIPKGDEYVFYDTKVLGFFLKHIRSQIVHAANVGWLIFGFILVWHVIKRVIKAFSSK